MHRQLFDSDETIDYAFMGQDPNAADNQWLREAFENQIPNRMKDRPDRDRLALRFERFKAAA